MFLTLPLMVSASLSGYTQGQGCSPPPYTPGLPFVVAKWLQGIQTSHFHSTTSQEEKRLCPRVSLTIPGSLLSLVQHRSFVHSLTNHCNKNGIICWESWANQGPFLELWEGLYPPQTPWLRKGRSTLFRSTYENPNPLLVFVPRSLFNVNSI